MKKMNFLKIAFTLVLAMAITGTFAQSTDVPGAATDYATTGALTVMEGTTVPIYALPDNYFHPTYDADAAGTLTAGFSWYWTEPSGDIVFSNNNPDAVTFTNEDNYTTISGFTVAGTNPYTINALEIAPAAWGGCDDGAGQNIVVTVVAQPAATLGGTTSYNLCAGDAGLPADVTATITGGWQNYRLVWSLEIKTLTGAGADKDFYETDKATPIVLAPFLAEEYTTAAPEAVGGAGAHAITSVAGGYTVIDASSTVYTYTLVSVNDQASRFGEFIGKNGVEGTDDTFNYYPLVAADEVVTIRVNPTPTTGPIYHIVNTWSN